MWREKKYSRFPEAIKGLIRAKNDFKHGRCPVADDDFRDGSSRVGVLLRSIMPDVGFLTA